VEAPRRRHADVRAVQVRVHEHVGRGGCESSLRAVRRARDGPDLLPGRTRELRLALARCARLREVRPCAALDHGRRARPHGPAEDGARELREVREVRGRDRLRRVPGPVPPPGGRGRLGGSGVDRRRLGRQGCCRRAASRVAPGARPARVAAPPVRATARPHTRPAPTIRYPGRRFVPKLPSTGIWLYQIIAPSSSASPDARIGLTPTRVTRACAVPAARTTVTPVTKNVTPASSAE